MYEVDFRPVENEDQDGGKSGDAIAMRFTVDGGAGDAVVVIDGGFRDVGDDLVDHIQTFYKTDRVDMVVSSHPDADHLNGLQTVIEEMDVRELMIHRPRLHTTNLKDFSNLEAVDDLLESARSRSVKITEPFTGETRFGGQFVVLGPTLDYYERLLGEQLSMKSAILRALQATGAARMLRRGGDLLDKVLQHMPIETLTDDGTTTERNNSSAICLLTADGKRFMFTGDAGIPALTAAAGYYEVAIGPFADNPLTLFQLPHHGSRRNAGPTILNRVLGRPGHAFGVDCIAMASSARASTKHPSPKVVNAASRRGCRVLATEGRGIHVRSNAPNRPGWDAVPPLPPLVETEDGE